jgi:hypothetical protein
LQNFATKFCKISQSKIITSKNRPLEASYGYYGEILYQVPVITNQIQWFDPGSESFPDLEPIQDPEPDPGLLFSSRDLKIRVLLGPIPDLEPFLDPELGHDPKLDPELFCK